MTARHRLGPRRSASGLTLIELMVAMVIGLVIMLAAVAALTVARRGFTTVDAASQLRDNGRFASDLIQRIGEQAGYRDFSIVASKLSTDATREPSIAGFNNSLLNAATPMTAATARTTGTAGYGSDILILRYQASQLYPNTEDPLLATVSDKSLIDCAGNNVATVSDPRTTALTTDNRIVSIFHVALNNGEPTLMCTYSPTGAAGSWTTVPLIQGVENFQVLYGVDRVVANTTLLPAVVASAPDLPDRYLRADQMTVAASANDTRDNWRRVRSVRIGMVLRTPPGATQDRNTQTFFPFGGVKDAAGNVSAALATTENGDAGTNFVPTPDGRLRQSVTFTFHLRNDQTL
ncbi:MAG TPA: PilW family protein [Variovorax sp.]|nr:PilW family protein [Variovorax sp.]